jgi:hypothetical protein
VKVYSIRGLDLINGIITALREQPQMSLKVRVTRPLANMFCNTLSVVV